MSSAGRESAWASELAPHLGGEVIGLRRLAGGASRLTFGFELAAGGRPHRMILQVERPGGFASAAGLVREAGLLELLGRDRIPAPRVVAAGPRLGDAGAWMVTRHLDGVTDPRHILEDPSLEPARRVLVSQLGEFSARLAAVDGTAVLGPAPFASDPVAELSHQLAQFDSRHAAFELGLRWLAGSSPPGGFGAPVLCHGDLRLGNLMVDAAGLVAAMDWELAGWGPVGADLGWSTVRAWRFGSARPVAGVGGRDELLAAANASAHPGAERLDEPSLRWWEVYGTIRWGVICLVQGSAHLSGSWPSMELAAVGLRVVEAEYDTMLLLEELGPPPRWASPPDRAPIAASVSGEPGRSAIEAVLGVASGGNDAPRDHRIGERLHAALARWPAGLERLSEIDAVMVRAARAVDDGDGWIELVAAVSASTSAKVAVVSPRYRA